MSVTDRQEMAELEEEIFQDAYAYLSAVGLEIHKFKVGLFYI